MVFCKHVAREDSVVVIIAGRFKVDGVRVGLSRVRCNFVLANGEKAVSDRVDKIARGAAWLGNILRKYAVPALGAHGTHCGCFCRWGTRLRQVRRATAPVLSGGMRIASRTRSAGTERTLNSENWTSCVEEGIDLGAVGGSRLVRIAVGRSVVMGGSPLIR